MQEQEYPTIVSTGLNTGTSLVSGTVGCDTDSTAGYCYGSASSHTISQGLTVFDAAISPAQEDEMTQRRVVQVFIVDPDERVPLEKALLYQGEQKLTDATDRELFFEIDIKRLLDRHNEERVQILDKEATAKSGRDVYLEPIRIRDLKMVVVNIATF